jgi:phosphonate transport system substrate-binding protein
MRRFRFAVQWMVWGMAMAAALCASQAHALCLGHAQPQQRFIFDVVPQFPAAKIHATWAPLLERVGQAAQVCFELRIAASIPEFEQVLWQGHAQWAYANPYHAVIAHKRHRYVPLLADGKEKLSGILVVPKDSPAQSVEALRGQSVAFPAPNAFAASLLIRAELARQRIDITPVFVKTHGNVYRSVITRDTFAGGGVNHTLGSESKEVQAQLRVLYETQSYTPHPVLAHPSVPVMWRQRVTQAFLALSNDEAGRRLLEGVNVDEPMAVTYERHYQPLEALKLDKFLVMAH